MRRARLAATALLVVWLLVLGFLLQPHHHPPPRITHARLLDRPVGNLPTLTPLPAGP